MRVDSNGCLDPDDCPVVNIITSTDEDLENAEPQIVFYPNPVEDILHIQMETNEFVLQIEIVDLNGRIVKSGILIKGQGEIGMSEMPAGAYLMSIKSAQQVLTSRKFVKS